MTSSPVGQQERDPDERPEEGRDDDQHHAREHAEGEQLGQQRGQHPGHEPVQPVGDRQHDVRDHAADQERQQRGPRRQRQPGAGRDERERERAPAERAGRDGPEPAGRPRTSGPSPGPGPAACRTASSGRVGPGERRRRAPCADSALGAPTTVILGSSDARSSPSRGHLRANGESTPSVAPSQRPCYHPRPVVDPWCSGPTCQPVTLEIAGSNPVGSAINPASSYAPSARPDGAFLFASYNPRRERT